MVKRTGITLLELLVAMAIVSLLMGLLLVSIQKVRQAAKDLGAKNDYKQIVLAAHGFEAEHGSFPTSGRAESSFFLAEILPYLEILPPYSTDGHLNGTHHLKIPIYINKSDPSLIHQATDFLAYSGPASLSINAYALQGTPTAARFQDGLSNTLGFTDHYHYTKKRRNWTLWTGLNLDSNIIYDENSFHEAKSAVFADKMWRDALPVTSGSPAQSRCSIPGKTFQHMPTFEESDGRLVQSFSPGGLKVAMMDGSVRTIHPGVSETAFWAAVTPAGSEVAGLD